MQGNGLMAPLLEKRQDDKIQNLILERLGSIEKKSDLTHGIVENISKICITRGFEIEKVKTNIDDHVEWHKSKKKKAERLKEAMFLSLFGTILFLAKDKITNILTIIFK